MYDSKNSNWANNLHSLPGSLVTVRPKDRKQVLCKSSRSNYSQPFNLVYIYTSGGSRIGQLNLRENTLFSFHTGGVNVEVETRETNTNQKQ